MTINTKDMRVTASGYNGYYDQAAHGITVNVEEPTGATVKYGTDAGTYNLDVSPTRTEVGTTTVYYQVTADNYTTSTGSADVIINAKQTQTISAENVTATYGDTGKSVSASVTEPATGGGSISYAVKSGSEDYIEINSSTGALTIKKAGTATVIVTAAETDTYAQTTKEVTVTISPAPTVASPTFSPREGHYTESQTVTISCETEGAVIYYTTDGRTEPSTESTPYNGSIIVSETTTIKAIAVKEGMNNSDVVTQTYTISAQEPMTKNVIIHHVKNNGSWGIPADMPGGEVELTITIKDGDAVSVGKVTMNVRDGMKDSGEVEVRFVPKVENLSDITVTGPKELIGAAPISQKYKLSYKASYKDVINIYVTWDDGKSSAEEKVKVVPLPEDEVGAYKILDDGTKEYLLFHTYDICMAWLGRDELCRGPERCYHKVWPYEINWMK